MKKIILMAVMVVLTLTVSAQVEKGMRYGISFTGAMCKYSEPSNTKNIFGYGAGLIMEYNFSPNIYLGTGLEFGLRGSKMDYLSNDLNSYNGSIPVNLGGRVNLSDNFSIFGQAGPYVSYALKQTEVQGIGTSEAFDWGFNGKIGIEFKQFQFFGGYELGMAKLWEDGKNRSIVFGIVYIL